MLINLLFIIILQRSWMKQRMRLWQICPHAVFDIVDSYVGLLQDSSSSLPLGSKNWLMLLGKIKIRLSRYR